MVILLADALGWADGGYHGTHLEAREAIADGRSQHPMAGTRSTRVPPPGGVSPWERAETVLPASLLPPRWEYELPFPKALLHATARRGRLVDPATRERRIGAGRRRAAEGQAE